MAIKVVAFDVYGTILASDDHDNGFRPRRGFCDFVKRCRDEGRIVVTASDADLDVQKRHLGATFRHWGEISGDEIGLDVFDNLFRLVETPKEFGVIVKHYGVHPREVYVFGDNYDKDILGAKAAGCLSLHVPEYRIMDRYGKFLPPDSFSFDNIRLE